MDMNLNKLQELVMNREVWCTAAHGVTNSRTQLSNWTELNYVGRYGNTEEPLILDGWTQYYGDNSIDLSQIHSGEKHLEMKSVKALQVYV